MSILSNLRRVHRHCEILASPEVREQVMAYMAARTVPIEDHQVWTGRRHEDGAPRGEVGCRRVVSWEDGGTTRGVRFDPRLLTWAAAGLPFDDAVVILPACGERLCLALAHLAAVPWTALGPDDPDDLVDEKLIEGAVSPL